MSYWKVDVRMAEVWGEPHEDDNRSGDDRSEVDRYIARLITGTLSGAEQDSDRTAPIILPDRKDLAVRLVSENALDRLRDAESDRALFDSALWCVIGGILGFFTNIITGGQPMSDAGVVFLTTLGTAVLVLCVFRVRLGRRLSAAREIVSR